MEDEKRYPEPLAGAVGNFAKVAPALDTAEQEQLCARCGFRRGVHQAISDACPSNPKGHPFRTDQSFEAL